MVKTGLDKKTRTVNQWNEICGMHPDWIVSFQENAWADTAGNLYNLEKQSSHLKKALEENKIINPQQFEDNLTSHRVDNYV